MELEKGDILNWWQDEWVITLPGGRTIKLPIKSPVPVHTDIYVGGGRVRTSIQNKGTCGATVDSRWKYFDKCTVVRVTQPVNMGKVMTQANTLTAEYDWAGYFGQYIDLFTNSDNWTRMLQNPNQLYCSEHAAKCYLLGAGIKVSGKDPEVTAPHDFIRFAKLHPVVRKIFEL